MPNVRLATVQVEVGDNPDGVGSEGTERIWKSWMCRMCRIPGSEEVQTMVLAKG